MILLSIEETSLSKTQLSNEKGLPLWRLLFIIIYSCVLFIVKLNIINN
nr:MAG TPA: hypothetical protein [Caudoviricetes sp.]